MDTDDDKSCITRGAHSPPSGGEWLGVRSRHKGEEKAGQRRTLASPLIQQ
jgi:hypothetical protein